MSDRILGAVCVVASAGMAWASSDYTAAISYEPVGPRAFPLLLASLMAVGGSWLVLRPTLKSGVLRGVPLKATALCASAVLVYALLFELLGFALATTVMALPVGVAFGGRWPQSLACGGALGFGLYLVFDRLLDVVLPTGLLSVVLGGQ